MIGNTWPEQEAVDNWIDKHKIDVNFNVALELKKEVSKYRIEVQNRQSELEQQTQWISVKDRLPETPDDVIVAYSDGTVTTLCYFKNDNVWMDEYGGEYDEISYWMPQPAPPTEVEDG